MNDPREIGNPNAASERRRRIATIVLIFASAALLAWGAMAALLPERLPGPGSKPILTAGYENFTNHSWSALEDTSPRTAQFIELLFRLFGVYIVAFALLAIAVTATAFRRGESWAWWVLSAGHTIAFGAPMTYDWIVGAIGPFEILEYVGLIAIYGALAVTAPFLAGARKERTS